MPSKNVFDVAAICSQACDKGMQWERALELLDRMAERDRAKPNLFAYNYAMSACVRQATPVIFLSLSLDRVC